MTQSVGSVVAEGQAEASQPPAHDPPQGVPAQRPYGRVQTHEYLSEGGVRPHLLEVAEDGVADGSRQGVDLLERRLGTGESDLFALPVEVFESESDRFAGPATVDAQQEQDGPVANGDRGVVASNL
jgi:hypothetical protein